MRNSSSKTISTALAVDSLQLLHRVRTVILQPRSPNTAYMTTPSVYHYNISPSLFQYKNIRYYFFLQNNNQVVLWNQYICLLPITNQIIIRSLVIIECVAFIFCYLYMFLVFYYIIWIFLFLLHCQPSRQQSSRVFKHLFCGTIKCT